jgi:hypothetical protein
VAVLDSQNWVGYVHVVLGRDSGGQVGASAGLKPGGRVVARPGDDLPGGAEAEPAAPVK